MLNKPISFLKKTINEQILYFYKGKENIIYFFWLYLILLFMKLDKYHLKDVCVSIYQAVTTITVTTFTRNDWTCNISLQPKKN